MITFLNNLLIGVFLRGKDKYIDITYQNKSRLSLQDTLSKSISKAINTLKSLSI